MRTHADEDITIISVKIPLSVFTLIRPTDFGLIRPFKTPLFPVQTG